MDLYINKHSIMGMLSKNQTIVEANGSIVRSQNKIFCFDVGVAENYMGVYRDIGFAYIPDRVKADHLNFYGKSTAVISGPFSQANMFDFPGQEFKGYRRTLNSLDGKVLVADRMLNPDDVLNVMADWNAVARDKYWRLHSGYDKNFFTSMYFAQEKDRLQTLFFYDKESMRCLGYSVISKLRNDSLGVPMFSYVIGKCVPDYANNLAFYLDLKTFQKLAVDLGGEFLIHWGASSGGVLNYKVGKFRHFVYDTYPVFFGKIIQPEPAGLF